jgi:peptide subunit release factor 1 (eRF1)
MTTKTQSPVDSLLDRLAALDPTEYPVLSLYLDTRPNDVGRPDFDAFLRKELKARIESFPRRSPERESVEADARRILDTVIEKRDRRAETVAVFACSGIGLFETIALEAPLLESRLYVARHPHLYPLARLAEQHRRYAALVADTHVARIFVFGLGVEVREEEVVSPKTRRTTMGGWSQMRYQRHVDHRHMKHAKEAASALTRIVREEEIEQVILAGDDVILPLMREELPKEILEKVIDHLALDARTPQHEVLSATLESFRKHDAATDVDVVMRLVDEYRADGLAVVGLQPSLAALEAGQVDELLLSAAPIGIDRSEDPEHDMSAGALSPAELARREGLAGDLVARARRTGASVRFVEDVNLMWELGGVGAFLRFRLTPAGPSVPDVQVPEPEPIS